MSGPVPLPTEKNVYCVIRSPFKDKDSREHFEIRTHKRLIDIHQPTPEDGRLAPAPRPPSRRRRHRDPPRDLTMPAILAKKLGMTQLFHEDGTRRARHRARGRSLPGHRDPHARARRLRGRPARVRRDEGEAPDQGRARASQEGRRAADEARRRVPRRGRRARRSARPSRSRRSRSANRSRSPAPRRARASRARSSATTSPAAPSPTARTTCAPRARSAPRRRPSRVMKGIRGPGQMGNKRVTQKGLTVVQPRPRAEPAARPRRRARPPQRLRGGPHRWLDGTRSSARTKTVDLDDAAFGARVQRPARARVRARGARRPPAGHARDQDARQGPRRRRQAVAPEGHRPRPRRLVALPDLDRRRHRLRPLAAPLHLQGQPQGAPRRAAQRAVACTPTAARSRSSTRPPSTSPSTKAAAGLLADWVSVGSVLIVLTDEQERAALSFRNLERVSVLPAQDVGVADLIGAAAVSPRRRRSTR